MDLQFVSCVSLKRATPSLFCFPSVSSMSLRGRAYVSVSVRAGSVEYGRVSRRQVLGLRMCYGVFACDKLHVCSHITSHSRVILQSWSGWTTCGGYRQRHPCCALLLRQRWCAFEDRGVHGPVGVSCFFYSRPAALIKSAREHPHGLPC